MALTEPLQYGFVRNGLLEVVLLAAACGLIGPFVVQHKLTFFGHALSHTIFPTLVLATVLGISPILGAALGAALTVGLVFHLQHRDKIGDDSAVGIVFVGLFAMGVVLVGWFHVKSPDVGAAVVGNLLGIGGADLLVSAVLAIGLVAVVGLLYRPLVLVSFDRLTAEALGLPVPALELTILAATAATAVVAVKSVGVILTVALLATPAASARLWSSHLPRIMLLSAIFVAAAGVLGLYTAYYVRVAPAAITVLTLAGVFVSSLVLSSSVRRGRHALCGARRDPYGFCTYTRSARRRARARRGATPT
jgi:manganese/iron transport system permease protein